MTKPLVYPPLTPDHLVDLSAVKSVNDLPDVVVLKCDKCGELYHRTRSRIRRALKCGQVHLYCSRDCTYLVMPNRKLTAVQVREIRRMKNLGISYRAIAARFGVNHNTIYKIIAERTYRNFA